MKWIIYILFSFLSTFCWSSSKIDSLKNIVIATANDSIKSFALLDLSFNYWYIDPDSAFEFANEAYHLSEKLLSKGKLKSKLPLAKANLCMAVTFDIKGMSQQSLSYANKALLIAEEVKDTATIARCYNNIGIVYRKMGDYPNSLNQYFKALSINKKIDNQSEVAKIIGNIGTVYWNQGEFEEALKYYKQSIAKYEELGDQSGAIRNKGNMANVLDDSGHPEEALEIYFEVVDYYRTNGFKAKEATYLGNIGTTFHKQRQVDTAITYFKRAYELDKELGNKYGMCRHLGSLAAAFGEIGQIDKAIKTFVESRTLAEEIEALAYVEQTNYLISKLYEEKGDFKNALETYKNYTQAKDSIFNQSKSKEIGKLEAQYEMEKKQEEEKRLAESEKLKAENEKSRRDNLQFSGIFVFVLLLFALVFMSGKFSMSEKVAEGLIFFTFLLFFEFLLVLADPYIEGWSGGEPLFKLLFNAILAAGIFPLHAFFETTLKKRLLHGK